MFFRVIDKRENTLYHVTMKWLHVLKGGMMSQFEKLKDKFRNAKADFTFTELNNLLLGLGYSKGNPGKTSGSAVRYLNKKGEVISVHRPHPDNQLKPYAIREIKTTLRQRGEL
jgi:hypothetical protein